MGCQVMSLVVSKRSVLTLTTDLCSEYLIARQSNEPRRVSNFILVVTGFSTFALIKAYERVLCHLGEECMRAYVADNCHRNCRVCKLPSLATPLLTVVATSNDTVPGLITSY